ncbi:MAG: hypothetical protein ACI8S6_005916 [Myxococcota bacterium]
MGRSARRDGLTVLERRTFLRCSAGLLGGLWVRPALAVEVPLAARLMATLDIHCRDDIPTRGLIAMGVVEQVQALPESERQAGPLQAVLQRACLWIGQSVEALRSHLVAVRDGAQIDEGAVEAALVVAGGGSRSQQQARARVSGQLRSGRRVRSARRLIARIDHAAQRAERRCAQGEVLEVRWLLETPEAASLPQKENILKTLVMFIVIIALAVLLVVGLILLIGGIVLIFGAATGNPVLIGLGFVIVIAGIVLLLVLVTGDLQRDHGVEMPVGSARG